MAAAYDELQAKFLKLKQAYTEVSARPAALCAAASLRFLLASVA